MKFRLACGHTVNVLPWTCWLTVIHQPCMRCIMIAKGALPKEDE